VLSASLFDNKSAKLPTKMTNKQLSSSTSGTSASQESEAIDRQQHLEHLRHTKTRKLGKLGEAEWLPALKVARIVKTEKFVNWTGWQHVEKFQFLFAEEALYLLEVGDLLLTCRGVPLSVQDAYSMLMCERRLTSAETLCTPDEYMLFASLSRSGYVLQRSSLPHGVVMPPKTTIPTTTSAVSTAATASSTDSAAADVAVRKRKLESELDNDETGACKKTRNDLDENGNEVVEEARGMWRRMDLSNIGESRVGFSDGPWDCSEFDEWAQESNKIVSEMNRSFEAEVDRIRTAAQRCEQLSHNHQYQNQHRNHHSQNYQHHQHNHYQNDHRNRSQRNQRHLERARAEAAAWELEYQARYGEIIKKFATSRTWRGYYEKLDGKTIFEWIRDNNNLPLVFADSESVLRKLKIFKETKVTGSIAEVNAAAAVETFGYNVYEKSKSFRKRNPGAPNYRVTMASPHGSVLLRSSCSNSGVPTKVAVVEGGFVAFYGLDNVRLPDYKFM